MRQIISIERTVHISELIAVRSGWITGVAWSPNGATLAIAGADGVRLYTGKFGGAPSYTLSGHQGHVKGAVFSPDQQILVSVSADTTARLWDVSDLANGVREMTILTGHGDSVDEAAFSPDGCWLATASADGYITVWDVKAQAEVARLRGHDAEVSSVTFAMNGSVLVSGGRDNRLHLWDTRSETGGTTLGQHDDWVRQVRANGPGTMLASASKDTTVRLWDVFTAETYAVIQAHTQGADCVAFSPDGALLATGGRDSVIRLWDVQAMLQKGSATLHDAVHVLHGHQRPVLNLAFNPAGTLLASGSGDNTVRLWAVKQQAE